MAPPPQKELIAKYGITWKEANDFLQQARTSLGSSVDEAVVYQAAETLVLQRQQRQAVVDQCQAATVQQVVAHESDRQSRRGRHVVLKKLRTGVSSAKAFNPHIKKDLELSGPSLTPRMIDMINRDLQREVHVAHGAILPVFEPAKANMTETTKYAAQMNHQSQLYYEEEILCCILETMEDLDYDYRLHYDAAYARTKMGNALHEKEVFIFRQRNT